MTDTPKTPKTSGKRDYVVLEQIGATAEPLGNPGAKKLLTSWDERGTFTATSESAAKKQAITTAHSDLLEFGALVAIPSRSWNPTTPKVTAQTVLKIEGI